MSDIITTHLLGLPSITPQHKAMLNQPEKYIDFPAWMNNLSRVSCKYNF